MPNTVTLLEDPPIYIGLSETNVKILKISRDTAGYFTDPLLTPPAGQWMFTAGIQILDSVANTYQFADSAAATAAGIVATEEQPPVPLLASQPWNDRIGAEPLFIMANRKLWIKTTANCSFLMAVYTTKRANVGGC